MYSLEPHLDLSSTTIHDFKKLTPAAYKKALHLGKELKNLPVIHINSTHSSGGVAELLQSQVAIERSLGLDSRWYVMGVPPSFFGISKKIHNLLQGKGGYLTGAEKKKYLEVNRGLEQSLALLCKKFRTGIFVIHDPQPMPLIRAIPERFAAVSRLHIDLLTPNFGLLEFLRPFLAQYRMAIISSDDYRRSLAWFPQRRIKVIPPAIDPFTEKNKPMSLETAKLMLVDEFSLHPEKPLISQVSRFDPWKDPMGVIRAYYLAKNKIPDLQLALVGSFAKDDPEGKDIYWLVKKHVRGDPAIKLWTKESSAIVNMIQTVSSVVLQKSIREGFGLTITEAMWKGKAVIAGKTTGAMMQIADRKSGVLVTSVEETARAIVRLLQDEAYRRKLGKAARRTVQNKFLMSHFIRDNLNVYAAIRK